ncbi:MAG: ElyC/SanA/YdcF family protein [Candidatus Zambryskibacteria bacterium]
MVTEIELLREFEDLYKQSPPIVPNCTDGIVILTGAVEPREENESRIRCGLNVLNTLGHPVPVIYSGETEERAEMLALMEQLGVPKSLSHFQDCGKRGVANTKTQFGALISNPPTMDMRDLVIVTSTYHIPRTKRTAGKFFPPQTRFVVVSDPEDWNICNSFLMIMGEIGRIVKYSAKGDILAHPRS